MGAETSIQWTATVNKDGSVTPGSTWNPTRGCSRISEGCRLCYAEGIAARFSGLHPKTGKPLAYHGLARMTDHGPRWTGKLVMALCQSTSTTRSVGSDRGGSSSTRCLTSSTRS